MHTVGIILSAVGLIWGAIAGQKLIGVAFGVSRQWGLICLLIPGGFIAFLTRNWKVGRKPFFAILPPAVLVTVAFVITAIGLMNKPNLKASGPVSRPKAASRTPVGYESNKSGFSTTTAPSTEADSESAAQEETAPSSIARGDEYRPDSPRTALSNVSYRDEDILLSELKGFPFGDRFDDEAPANGILIGLRIGCDDSNCIASVCPIYQYNDRCVYGAVHGVPGVKEHVLIAKPDYAVGGIILTSSTQVQSIQAIFLKIDQARLNPSDRYLSEVVGEEVKKKSRIFGEGRLIVELNGLVDRGVCSLGLAAVDPLPQSTPAAAKAEGTSAQSNATSSQSFGSQPGTAAAQPKQSATIAAEKPENATSSAPPASSASNSPAESAKTESAPSTPAPSGDEPFRSWSSSMGNFSVVAKFKSISGNQVVLENEAGKTVRVAIDKLSQADQDYLKTRPSK